MSKNYFGLVVAAGLAGAVAIACSSTGGGGTTPVDDAGSKADVKQPKPDVVQPVVDAGPETCPIDATGQKADVIKLTDEAPPKGFGPYKPIGAAAGQCTEANATALQAFVKAGVAAGGLTYVKIIEEVKKYSAACAECMFKPLSGAAGAAYYTVDIPASDAGPATTGALRSTGSEYQARGATAACATQIRYFEECAVLTCSQCPDADQQQCEADQSKAASSCGTEFIKDVQTACADAASTAALTKVSDVAKKVTAAPLSYTFQLPVDMAVVCGAP
jgi:hypothetical protein